MAQQAQDQQTAVYNQQFQASQAANASMEARIKADNDALAAEQAKANATIGQPQSNAGRLAKFDGLKTVGTSLLGDSSTPATAKQRLLS